MTRPPKKSRRKRDSNLGSSALEADALTTRPRRRCEVERQGSTARCSRGSEVRGGVGMCARVTAACGCSMKRTFRVRERHGNGVVVVVGGGGSKKKEEGMTDR